MSWRAGSVPAHARVDVAVIGGNGRVVAEYFDVDRSRFGGQPRVVIDCL